MKSFFLIVITKLKGSIGSCRQEIYIFNSKWPVAKISQHVFLPITDLRYELGLTGTSCLRREAVDLLCHGDASKPQSHLSHW